MMTDEVKVIVMAGFSLAILSAVITFGMYLVNLRTDFADTHNSINQTKLAIKEDNKYKEFNNTSVTGVDVISAVRDYYEEGVSVGVRNKEGNLIYNLTVDTIKDTPDMVDYEKLTDIFASDMLFDAKLVKDDGIFKTLDKITLDEKGSMVYEKNGIKVDPKTLKETSQEVSAVMFFQTR